MRYLELKEYISSADIDEKLITDDRLFDSDDSAPLYCEDCAGCSSCCERGRRNEERCGNRAGSDDAADPTDCGDAGDHGG